MSSLDDINPGDLIEYSSGGSVHVGRVIELLAHHHFRVDTSRIVIPPGWVKGKVTAG